MKFIEDQFNKMRPLFEKGGKLEKLWPLYEGQETFMFVKPDRTSGGAHIRDNSDTKRLMSIVIVALLPCLLFGIYNVGLQNYLATNSEETATFIGRIAFGARWVLPIVFVSYAVGGFWEVIFCVVRKHEINEGFLVTGMLFPLVLPPTIPLIWVAAGVTFGVVIGKEVFGGTGMNIFNPALTARALVFFAYPTTISGSTVWTKITEGQTMVDGYSGATPLAVAAEAGGKAVDALNNFPAFANYSFHSMFVGTIPGSIGETSALACLIGAAILLITGVGSFRIMAGVIIGVAVMGVALVLGVGGTSGIMTLPVHYQFVMGGLMFGMVFMATDPVSASHTDLGKWIYGFLIGVMVVIVRLINVAFPEGMMLSILFMNAFSPLIDYFVVQRNIKRRLARVQVA